MLYCRVMVQRAELYCGCRPCTVLYCTVLVVEVKKSRRWAFFGETVDLIRYVELHGSGRLRVRTYDVIRTW